jgi:sialate O-acetylesterase
MKLRICFPSFVALALVCSVVSVHADITLPPLISDHMVLQGAEKVPVWGKADPGEEIVVSIAGKSATTKAADDGKWMVFLDLTETGSGPFEMTVQGKNKVVVRDVVVGEVWLASGQSNMEWALSKTSRAEEEIAGSLNPLLRQFSVKKNASPHPAEDVEGSWVIASPETSGGFTAVGYYFGKHLQNVLGRPIGIVHSSWGGTPSEAWTSEEALGTVPDLKAASDRIRADVIEYPARKAAFVEQMGSWLEETGREDRRDADAAAFAGNDVATDTWIPISLPGDVRAGELPDWGAVWLRKEIDIPAVPSTNLELILPIDGFDSVYWNGKLLQETTFETFAGLRDVRRRGPLSIPPADIKPGTNILAIRLFQPAVPAKFTAEPRAGSQSLSGSWLAKAEYELPAPPADNPAPVPMNVASETKNAPAFLYNGMIDPLIPYAIRGAIWYQGESNAGRAWQYRTAFPLLIADWRKQWEQGDFPFYFCQLANYQAKTSEPGESAWAELREAQSLTLSLPNTGQAILIDLGESADIHPMNKKDVGDRLALIALAGEYGKEISFSGPVFDSVKFEGGKAIVSFKHVDGGLVAGSLGETYDVRKSAGETAPLVRNSPESELEGFAVCGADLVWHWADAKIEGDSVVVSSPSVPEPVAVRYAWANNPTCNLYNRAGLPAGPFRTDDFPATTRENKL